MVTGNTCSYAETTRPTTCATFGGLGSDAVHVFYGCAGDTVHAAITSAVSFPNASVAVKLNC